MAEHTPTPWEYVPSTENHGPYITSAHGGTVADLYLMSQPGMASVRNGGTSKPVHFFHEMADPNAALIVRAVNSHDALVKALQAARYWVTRTAISKESTEASRMALADLGAIDAALASAQRVEGE